MNIQCFTGLDLCHAGLRFLPVGSRSFSTVLFMAAAFAFFLVVTPGAAALDIARDGRFLAPVVIAPSAASGELRAAEALRDYLGRISGSRPVLLREPTDGKTPTPAIHVGATRQGRQLAGRRKLSGDAFAVEINTDSVIIVGGTPLGTLFGVYRFLEVWLGCRWLTPEIETVPRRGTLTLTKAERVFRPAFDLRTFISRRSVVRSEWGIKMGMNGFYTREFARTHGNAYYFPAAVPMCHAYHLIMPADKYFDQHPEWYPLRDGKRRPTRLHSSQLCVTAPGLADAFARNVIAIFDRDPDCRLISISPNDGYGWCECETCRALDEKLCRARATRQGLAGERPFRGDRVFWFANEVAKRVAGKYPDKRLLELAYINYAEPPDTIRPRPNVVPWLCHYAPADYSRPIADPTSAPNAQFNALLIKWARLAPHLLFYSYVSKSMWWRLPRPVTMTFAADIRYLHSLGIHRYYCQSTLSDWQEAGPLYYVIAKLLWNPDRDPAALVADWTDHMFGPAAGAMRAYYAAVSRAVHTTGKSFSDNPPRQVPGLYDRRDLDQAEHHLEAALTQAPNAEIRERIDAIQKVFAYGRLVIRGLEAADRFRTAADPNAPGEARACLRKALALYNRREVRRFLEQLRLSNQCGVPASGFGDMEKRGGRDCWNTDETGPGDGRAGWATFIIPLPEKRDTPVRIEMDVWGESALSAIVINTGGKGKSYADGGIWKPVKPARPLSGKPGWETLTFSIPPDLMPPSGKSVRVGLGGGDSQIWIAAIRVNP